MRRIEGVTESVNATMNAVQANVLDSDGMLFRTCDCGINHPVGHLHRELRTEGEFSDAKRHHRRSELVPSVTYAPCCGCCSSFGVENNSRPAA